MGCDSMLVVRLITHLTQGGIWQWTVDMWYYQENLHEEAQVQNATRTVLELNYSLSYVLYNTSQIV